MEENRENKQFFKAEVQEVNFGKNKKLLRKYLLFFAVVFLLAGSFFIGYGKGKKDADVLSKKVPLNEAIVENKLPTEDKKIDFSLFWRVWDLLKEKHINKDAFEANTLVYGAISGMLKATGDPYTSFFNPSASQVFAQDIEGSFEGIGAELGIKDDILTIIAPLEGSPAEIAGLRAGDKILKVDEKIVADLTIDEAVDLIRGPKETAVKLVILHTGEQETREISIVRDTIEIKSVELEFKDNGIVHLKITKFSENTDKEFNDVVSTIISRETRGIILDLRNNPGGLLDKSVFVASRMIPKEKIVVTEENSIGKKEDFFTLGGDKLSSIPTVVLINEGSASAAEILAGALRDNQGTTLIGKKSFGKGSVQQLIDLPGGSSVKITVAKWLTPNGNYIMETGIDPDIEVEMTLDDYEKDRDPQLEKALEIIKEKI